MPTPLPIFGRVDQGLISAITGVKQEWIGVEIKHGGRRERHRYERIGEQQGTGIAVEQRHFHNRAEPHFERAYRLPIKLGGKGRLHLLRQYLRALGGES